MRRLRTRSPYGLVELDDDNEVIDSQENADNPPTILVLIACHGFPSDVLPLLDEYLAGDDNPDEPGWFLQWLQAQEIVHAFTFEDAWYDIDTSGLYLDAVAYTSVGRQPFIRVLMSRTQPSATTVRC